MLLLIVLFSLARSMIADVTASDADAGRDLEGGTAASPIIAFLTGSGRDSLNRSHDEILGFDDDDLEACHDFIQWLFPLHEPSAFSSSAPVMSVAETRIIAESAVAASRFRGALRVMRRFLGVTGAGEGESEVSISAEGGGDVANRIRNGDHNLLRITRILRSLRLAGLEAEAALFLRDVTSVGRKNNVSERTLGFWRRAAEEPLFASLR